MNITPLLLFLILLVTLILSSIFSKYINLNSNSNSNTETFVNFNYNTTPLKYVYIPQYSTSSSNVVKLFDNLFYDTTNGNLIEVDGVPLSGNTGNTSPSSLSFDYNIDNIDNKGLSINSIYVITRDGNSSDKYRTSCNGNVMLNGNLVCGQNAVTAFDTEESKIPFIFNSDIHTSIPYYYTTRSLNTHRYMVSYIPWSTSTFIHIINVSTRKHVSSFLFNENGDPQKYDYNDSVDDIIVGKAILDNNPNNDKEIIEPLYDTNQKVHQLTTNVKYDSTNSYLIINSRTGITIYNRYGNVITDKSTREKTIPKTIFQPWIVSDNDNNMVLYMQNQFKTLIFYITLDNTNNFISTYTYRIPSEINTSGSTSSSGSLNTNTCTNTTNTTNKDDDYILKSQIVPPVCPSCPTCPSFNGSCVNCNKLTNNDTTKKTEPPKGDNNSLLSISLNSKSDTNINNNGMGGGLNTGGLNTSGLNTGGLNNGLPPNNKENKTPFSEAGTSSSIAGINNYSQYGASNSTPSNFIPITADFSSFGN
jgi:hypothetical protein